MRKMAYSAAFRCLAGCDGSYPLTQAIYRCPSCGGLLDVAHDMTALKDRGPAAWMKIFDDRYKRTAWPYGSGVWGKREWIAPNVPDDAIVSPPRRSSSFSCGAKSTTSSRPPGPSSRAASMIAAPGCWA